MEFTSTQMEISLSYKRIVHHSCLGYLEPKSSFPVKGLPFGGSAPPLTGETDILVLSPENRKIVHSAVEFNLAYVKFSYKKHLTQHQLF